MSRNNDQSLYRAPESLTPACTHYCSGCGHGVAHRLIAEVIDELGIREKTVGVAPVGCAVLAYDYFNFDVCEAPHGRPPAVATGMKRFRPDLAVFTYQGDGDLAAIGTAEIIHAANRGERITVIFVNNGIYGMTGGQMAPTTLIGQKTRTTPAGRDLSLTGPPIRVCEVLAQLEGTGYVARGALDRPANILKAKKFIRRAFENQFSGQGLSLVELLSACPTYWALSPTAGARRISEVVIPHYPIGVIKEGAGNRDGGGEDEG